MNNLNEVALTGRLVGDFVLSHKNNGERFFENVVLVHRASETVDNIVLIVPEVFTDGIDINEKISVTGDIRTHNENNRNTFPKMKIYLFVKDIWNSGSKEDENCVSLTGVICRNPIYRITPKGREITEIIIAVNRAYGKTDYIPCICWGRTAKSSEKLSVGNTVRVLGRMQSRMYKKLINGIIHERIAYEVSVLNIQAVRD